MGSGEWGTEEKTRDRKLGFKPRPMLSGLVSPLPTHFKIKECF
ncbi:hypothetical protein [Nostoc sp.]